MLSHMNSIAEKQTPDAIGPEILSGSEAFYRTALESLSEGVMILDSECRIIYANRLVHEITGYAPDELLGQTPSPLRADSEPAACTTSKGENDDPRSFEFEMKRKDGRLHWIHVKAAPYRNDDGRVLGRVVALSCIAKQKNLELENEFLQEEFRASFGNIIGHTPALQKVLAQIATVAPTEANVLILGESGTGKELVARAIHDLSARKKQPLVRVNCASIPKELFESEFFGHVRGAFTGAIKDRVGRFELADGGTLFLDEIGEIPLELQGKLLRVLQEGQFERVGEERTRHIDVRAIAATNRDLKAQVRRGRFREDLYFRLNVFPIDLVPLRERAEDIPLIAMHLLQEATRKLNAGKLLMTEADARKLAQYAWPGNVRELQNVIERAAILARNGRIRIDLPDVGSTSQNGRRAPVTSKSSILTEEDRRDRDRGNILGALEACNGKVFGRG